MFKPGKTLILLAMNLIGFLRRGTRPYFPERHYMRGPGPACERKRADGGAVQGARSEALSR
jgi:hypothetical protein